MANQFVDRMIRAAKLDVALYEEVEADKSAMGQSVGVVLLSSVAAGIGNVYLGGGSSLILGAIWALFAWFLWAFLTFIIGTKLLPQEQTNADYGQLLRTIGFSSAPGVLKIFGIIPGIGGLIVFIASIWMLAAMVIAVRQALDYTSTGRAIGVCLIGWLIQIILVAGLITLAGAGTV